MTNEKLEYIRGVVQDIRNFFNLKDSLNREDLLELIRKLKGTFQADKDLEVDAKIEKNIENTVFKITIRKQFYELRDNFSIAHELGHLFLHMGYLTDPMLWKNSNDRFDRFGYSQEELEANEFAGNLLMPESEFIKNFRNNYNDEKKIVNLKKLSQFFQVSPKAIEIRAKNIGLMK